jgi:hypothetical protein
MCDASGCTSGPCDGICNTATSFTIPWSGSGNFNTTSALCYQTISNIQDGNCSNFTSPKTLSLNNVVMGCSGWKASNGGVLPPKKGGGYCISISAGPETYASFTAW